MAIASDKEETVEIPHEPGASFRLRGLGITDLKAAREVSAAESRRAARDFGTEIYEGLTNRKPDPDAPKPVIDPFNIYDTVALLDRGLLGWSYALHLPERSSDPKRQEERLIALGKLDPKTAEWAARTLLEMSQVENAWGADTRAVAGTRIENDDVPEEDQLGPLPSASWSPSIV